MENKKKKKNKKERGEIKRGKKVLFSLGNRQKTLTAGRIVCT